MASEQEELLFGRLALHYKLITAAQLDEVHGLHALAGGRRQLPGMLVEMGYLTQRQVEQLLVVRREYLEKRRRQPERDAPGTPPAGGATDSSPAPAGGAAAAPSSGSGAPAVAAAATLAADDTVATGESLAAAGP